MRRNINEEGGQGNGMVAATVIAPKERSRKPGLFLDTPKQEQAGADRQPQRKEDFGLGQKSQTTTETKGDGHPEFFFAKPASQKRDGENRQDQPMHNFGTIRSDVIEDSERVVLREGEPHHNRQARGDGGELVGAPVKTTIDDQQKNDGEERRFEMTRVRKETPKILNKSAW